MPVRKKKKKKKKKRKKGFKFRTFYWSFSSDIMAVMGLNFVTCDIKTKKKKK